MLSAFRFFIFLPFAAGTIRSVSGYSSNNSSIRSGLIISRFLPDGEFERVTTWPGFCTKETSADWGEIDVTLREVWLREEGRKLRLIYEGGTLTDCFDYEIEEPREKIEDDKEEDICSFDMEISKELGTDVEFLSPNDFSPKNIAHWFTSPNELRRSCIRVRNRTRSQALSQNGQPIRVRRGILQDLFFAPGTKWCGPTQLASRYNELGAFDQLDRCCRRHDHCHRAIPPMTQRYNVYNHMPFTLSHCGCDQRKYQTQEKPKRRRRRGRGRGKRDLFLVPGTQWCGRGHRATKYTNLGGFGSADACCRRHDTTCPFFIPAFETKYDLFNWGVSTLMHCACDERFRTCLKMAGTSSANFVGKLFFNVVQTKCFVLKAQKGCLRRSKHGKCEAYEYRKKAHLRDNVPY